MILPVAEHIGLTGDEAAARLERNGHNELPTAKPRSLLAIAWDVVREPMFLLLIGASYRSRAPSSGKSDEPC